MRAGFKSKLCLGVVFPVLAYCCFAIATRSIIRSGRATWRKARAQRACADLLHYREDQGVRWRHEPKREGDDGERVAWVHGERCPAQPWLGHLEQRRRHAVLRADGSSGECARGKQIEAREAGGMSWPRSLFRLLRPSPVRRPPLFSAFPSRPPPGPAEGLRGPRRQPRRPPLGRRHRARQRRRDTGAAGGQQANWSSRTCTPTTQGHSTAPAGERGRSQHPQQARNRAPTSQPTVPRPPTPLRAHTMAHSRHAKRQRTPATTTG